MLTSPKALNMRVFVILEFERTPKKPAKLLCAIWRIMGEEKQEKEGEGGCLFVWLVGFLTSAISRAGPKTERLTILRAATHETELGDHDFCLSRSQYTDTDPTSWKRAATAGIEPGTSFQESRALPTELPRGREVEHNKLNKKEMGKGEQKEILVNWFFNVLASNLAISRTGPKTDD